MPRASDIDGLLEDTIEPSSIRRRSSRKGRARARVETPPLIAQWKAEQATQGWFKKWATSQVAGYRLELIVGYLSLMLFGGSAIAAGIPVFSFTTPAGWLPIWGTALIMGGFLAAVGALRAGEEPITRTIRLFNRLELAGTITLFLMLGTYATLMLLIGNGAFAAQRVASEDTATTLANLARVAIGCLILATASHPTIRMVWLIFRPGKIKPGPISALLTAAGPKAVDSDADSTGTVK